MESQQTSQVLTLRARSAASSALQGKGAKPGACIGSL